VTGLRIAISVAATALIAAVADPDGQRALSHSRKTHTYTVLA
jgi:hypothetical protein